MSGRFSLNKDYYYLSSGQNGNKTVSDIYFQQFMYKQSRVTLFIEDKIFYHRSTSHQPEGLVHTQKTLIVTGWWLLFRRRSMDSLEAQLVEHSKLNWEVLGSFPGWGIGFFPPDKTAIRLSAISIFNKKIIMCIFNQLLSSEQWFCTVLKVFIWRKYWLDNFLSKLEVVKTRMEMQKVSNVGDSDVLEIQEKDISLRVASWD